MTFLEDSPYPDDHPFSIYVRNLRGGTSVSWFSRSANVNALRDYLWDLMNLRHENVRHSLEGFARTSAGTVLFVTATSDHGSIITCFPLDHIGVDRINNAINDEHEKMSSELQRGSYVGNPADAHNAIVEGGVDTHGASVFDFVNRATIVRLDTQGTGDR